MKSELIIDVRPQEVAIAVLEDDMLFEFQREQQNVAFSVGDVYLGRVKKIMPGLNAAFVDIGHERDAFLHFRDLGSGYLTARKFLETQRKFGTNFSPERVGLEKEISKKGAIADYLEQGQEVMVQITKEAISTKGPRLSMELSFAGRYLVLIPFSDHVSISQKIRSKQERHRLRSLVESIKPRNVTVIIRTSAQGVKVAELHHELRTLVNKWLKTVENLSNEPRFQKKSQQQKGGNAKRNNTQNNQNQVAVRMLHQESSRTLSLLRDTYDSGFKNIYINDRSLVHEVTEYIELIDPGKGHIVKLYEGRQPIFDHFGVSRQVKHLFGKTVTFKKGAYLVIEQTEAMHVIDVNSGNRARGSNKQEETAVDVNMAAAEEIARQLRLRDLGGIIIIDFIDMSKSSYRQALFEKMNQLMKSDRANHTILPITKFGLMQITRQRVRPSMKIKTEEVCPTCLGTGEIQPSIFFTDTIEKLIKKAVEEEEVKQFTIHLHPYVTAFVVRKKSLFGLQIGESQLSKWRSKYSKGIRVMSDQSLGMMSYAFYDKDGNEFSHLLEDDDPKDDDDD